ncbi:MAG TPA: O-antigen ligase family protein [Anaerolineales bacterium]|nr:O-antigen ligase family protein [Anaerolineales bacterium]
MRKTAYWACLALLFIIPWENFIFVSGFGTISRVSGFVVIGLWLASLATTNEIRKLQPFHLVFGFFLIWQVISLVWSIDREASGVRIGTSIQLFILIVMVWDLLRDIVDLERGMQAWVLGGVVTAVSVFQNYYLRTYVTEFRTSAAGFNLNDASLILAIGIPFAWYLAAKSEGKPAAIRWLNYLYIPAAVIAILLTGGRVSLAATIPGFLFILGTFNSVSSRWRVLALVSVVAIVYLSQSLVPQTTVDRLTVGTVEEVEDLDLNGRKEIWLDALEVYLTAPVFGIGVGSGPTAIQSSIHNTLIAIILETGVVGLIVFAWLVYKLFQELRIQPGSLMKSLWVNTVLIVLMANMLHSWQYRKQTWLVLTFVLISAHLARRTTELRQQTRVQTEPALPAVRYTE